MADPQHWGPVDTQPLAVRAKGSRGRRVVKRIFQVVGILAALSIIAGVAIVAIGYNSTKLPDPNADFKTATTFVYYNDGKSQLGSFAIQNRQPLAYKDMPKTMTDAIVSAENRDFWTDKGISIRGMIRAAWVIARGGDVQGGSTITQQYIKIMYLNSEQKLSRKFKELFLAYKINKEKSKEQILEDYLNTIYFGHGAYGLQAAAKAYFNVDAKKLTVRQSAVLVTVLNNPTYFDPSDEDNLPQVLDRYRYVLNSMVETGAITAEQNAKWSQKLPKFPDVPLNERYGGPKGFLLKMVERELSDIPGFDAKKINGGGLKITTTFDKDAQDAAVEAAQSVTKQAATASGQKAKNLHAAIASVDVNSGEVLALYGGPDYVKNSRNWATTARPTASTFKAYALAAGLKDDYSLYSRFHGNSFNLPGDPKIVRNEYSRNYGYTVDLIKATTLSINTAFVDLVTTMDDGRDKVLKLAQAAGLPKTRGWDAAARNVPIGTPEVSPLDQASGYATFANGGVHVDNHVVKEVRDANGTVLYKAKPKDNRAMSEDVSRDVTFALSNVVENGTGSSVQTLQRPVAGKTGTNGVDISPTKNIVNSSWFVGYTKQISTAVMFVAGNSGSKSLDPYARPGDSTFFGGTYPAQTWSKYMAVATKGQAVRSFDPPAYVNREKAPQPTQTPTARPTQSQEPSREPSQTPSQTPSQAPSSQEPSNEPSSSSSDEPSRQPSRQPSPGPSGR